jgi:SAM-dependent methyltransferase
MRRRKSAGVVSLFLKQHYGIGWKDISAKLRSALLEEVEHVSCNLCGRDDALPVAQRDKYGLPLTTVMCRGCGLLYLNPRPTAATYRKFYEEGGQRDSVYHRRVDFNSVGDLLKFYYGPGFEMDEAAQEAMTRFMAERRIGADCRPLSEPETEGDARSGDQLEGFDGLDWEPEDDGDGLEEEEDGTVDWSGIPPCIDTGTVGSEGKLNYYGVHIYEELKEYVPAGGKVFEPGCSWGKMLLPWKELHGCEATGVEPKKESVLAAKEQLGLDVLQGFADDPRIPENAYDLVLNTRTINHMLDPLGDLRNARRWLKPGGILFVDIQDAIREARYEGFERNVVEIDHVYMFSLNTLTAMVQQVGFSVVKSEIQDLQRARVWDERSPQAKQIHIVARKSDGPVAVDWPDPLAELADLLRAQLAFDRNQVKMAADRQEKYRQAMIRQRGRYDKLRARHQRVREEFDRLRARSSMQAQASATARSTVDKVTPSSVKKGMRCQPDAAPAGALASLKQLLSFAGRRPARKDKREKQEEVKAERSAKRSR